MNDFTRPHLEKLPDAVVYKWSRHVLTEGFVPFPKKLLRCIDRILVGGDPIAELQVILAVVDFKRPNASRLPSMTYLSFLAGMEEAKFQKVLGELQDRHLVHIEINQQQVDVSLNGLLAAIEKETK